MKDLEKTKFYLCLQIEHFPTGVLVHQSPFTKNSLKHFYIDKVHPLSIPMVVHSLDVKNDLFRPCEKGEELLDNEMVASIYYATSKEQLIWIYFTQRN